MIENEEQAREGLAVDRFPVEWERAKELCVVNWPGDILPYWWRVRIIFVELGGEVVQAAD